MIIKRESAKQNIKQNCVQQQAFKYGYSNNV